jgi:uncharacterized protein YdhG (YjbR/CyaY superfamily)
MEKSAPGSVDEYLDAVPEPARSTLQKVRAIIRAAAPKEATEAIGYGMPTFRYQGGLIGYAAFQKHCSIFPMSVAVIEAHADELKKYRTSKGTLQFPVDKAPPAALIKKLVKARVAENEAKKAK